MTRKFCAVMAMLVLSIVFCGQASAAKNADIVFFIDSSGSMQNDIDGVRTNLAAFSRSMASSDVDARFAIVEYQYTRGIVVHKPNGTDTWTSDTSQVETVLASITADDGDGYTMNAINEVFSWGDFRSDASRFGFMLTDVMRLNNDYGDDVWIDDTDAASEDISTISTLMESTVQQLNSMGMNMSVVSTPGLRSPYQSLYSQTGGVFNDITTSDYYRSMLDMGS